MSKWPIKTLGEIAVIGAGDPAPQGNDAFCADGVPFVRMQDVGRAGRTDNLVETVDRVTPSAALSLKLFRKGTILVPKSGASIKLNHRAILGMDAHVVSHLATLLPRSGVDGRFLYHFLCAIDLSKVAHETDFPSLKLGDLERVEIPLPPLAEQERIVRLLDEAVTLRRVRTQADERSAAAIPALFDEMFGAVAMRDATWPTTSVGQICDLVNGAAFKPDDWDTTGLPIIRIQNLNDPGKPFNLCSHPMPEKYRVRRGDILLSWSGTPGTSFGCFRWGGPEGWLNQHIFNVRLNPEIDGEFFIEAINARLAELIAKAHGGVGLQHVTKGTLNAVRLPRPPITLQRTFATRVAEIRALEAEQATSRQRLDDLFRSLLHRAFNGDL